MQNQKNKSKPKINLFEGQTFVPFGTDSIGVITKVQSSQVEFHYAHDNTKRYVIDKSHLIKFAHIMPKKPPIAPRAEVLAALAGKVGKA